jgi:hypothetical protein
MFVATNIWLWEQIIGCENKNLWMWEQKPMVLAIKHMVVGTKKYGCENKHLGMWEQKPMVVGTNLFLWGQIYGWINKS